MYWGSYLKNTARLTTEGHGAYLLLIAEYWVTGTPLPDSNSQLSAITRLSQKRWRMLRPEIERYFSVQDGVWRHGRIDDELAQAVDITKKRSRAGLAGAEARYGKRNGEGIANGVADPLANPQQTAAPLPSTNYLKLDHPLESEKVAPHARHPDSPDPTVPIEHPHDPRLRKIRRALLEANGSSEAEIGTLEVSAALDGMRQIRGWVRAGLGIDEIEPLGIGMIRRAAGGRAANIWPYLDASMMAESRRRTVEAEQSRVTPEGLPPMDHRETHMRAQVTLLLDPARGWWTDELPAPIRGRPHEWPPYFWKRLDSPKRPEVEAAWRRWLDVDKTFNERWAYLSDKGIDPRTFSTETGDPPAPPIEADPSDILDRLPAVNEAAV